MCESTLFPSVRQVSQGFDLSNPTHFYVGRYTKHYRAGQPFLGNPFKIHRDGNRTQVLAKYKSYLWQRLQQDPNLRDWLHNLPENAILFCHCAPLPCHADIILKAAAWLKQQWSLEDTDPFATGATTSTEADPKPAPGDVRIPFGCHQGKTLDEVFSERPSYIDWLGSFVSYGRFQEQVYRFLDQPYVKNEIDRKFFDTDTKTGLPFTTYECFVPSEQTAKHFNLGKPTFLKVEYGPFQVKNDAWIRSPATRRKLAKGIKHDGSEYRRRLSLPLYERDWDGRTNEDAEHPRITSTMEAWEVAADLLCAIDNAECLDFIDLDARCEQLTDWLPKNQMDHIRSKWIEKRDRLQLVSLLPDWQRNDALLALDAINEDAELEAILREQAPELADAVALLRLS
jgi:Domain of unknown function (DUF4326)